MSPTSLMFKVHRSQPQLIAPAKPTPHEFKTLSSIDNQDSTRFYIPVIHFYPHNSSMNGVDPVEIIRKAISETLFYYYPFAGRLREGPSRKLTVECTGEGILFVEADADVTLDHFGYPLAPPFPCLDQLLFDVPNAIFDSPLLLVQVTRLMCGGFILGVLLNHCMSDASGLVQFMSAIGEMARGATSLSVLPVWERHLLNFRNPPQYTPPLPSSDNINNNLEVPTEHDFRCQTFLFQPTEISALRRCLPPHLQRHYSSYEILIGCIWRCHVVALQPHPTDEMILIFPVNLRVNTKSNHLILPTGYYGNATLPSVSRSTAKEILEHPLSYTLQLVQNGKDKASEDDIQSLASLMASKGSFIVSDLRYIGFEEVDFGWGKAAYGGPAICAPKCGFQMPFKNKKGEKGILFPICLPSQAMERFVKELDNVFKGDGNAIISKL